MLLEGQASSAKMTSPEWDQANSTGMPPNQKSKQSLKTNLSAMFIER
jgi:hypothetical protein